MQLRTLRWSLVQMNKTLKFKVCLLCLFVAVQVSAQQTTSDDAAPRAVISGRVVASDGNFPIVNARVMARAAGVGGSMRVATTDEDGKFQLTNLVPSNYVIRVGAAGYIPEPLLSATPTPFYRPGESVTIKMIKGGVITGRVLNKNGEPMALARVRSVRVKDAEGNPVRDVVTGRDWTTDDRGMYRAYGLEAGAYIVSATFTNIFRATPSQLSSTTGQAVEAAPTYHPSSTLDDATLVNVQAGNETGGIDIRYRAERSHAVRGTVAGQNVQSGAQPARTAISVTLSHTSTGMAVASTTNVPVTGAVFNFEGIADGVYELTAQTGAGTSDAAIALAQRVNVQGASVTDIVLTLTPMGSIAGRVVVETTELVEACPRADKSLVEETLISAHREAAAGKQMKSFTSLLPVEARPDARGEFLLTNMTAGRYVLDVRPPSTFWYVRDIAWENAAATNDAPSKSPLNGVSLKLGERANGLRVKLAHGAANITGRVLSAGTGASLPASLRVYVVPAEREHVNNGLRYAESPVQVDGAFSITNLAPGHYLLLVREADATMTRAALRREAEKAKAEVQLQPCQKLVNHTLRFTP